jgi:RimJ/RimL family protein N-acetyltransferase
VITPALSADRLDMIPFTADFVDALLSGDRTRLVELVGAEFPQPVCPPLMADALPFMRDRLRAEPEEVGWWGWLAVLRSTREAVGSAGLGGKPDADGVVLMGYSIYPQFEGHGYATEAVRALLAWVLAQAGVASVRATVPPWNAPSIRVAEKAGMQNVGVEHDIEAGEVLVYEVQRPQSTRAGPDTVGDNVR